MTFARCLNQIASTAAGLLALAPLAHAGKIIVHHDEWPLSTTGFQQAPTMTQYARNVAAFFTGGGPGRFLVLTNNFGLDNASVSAAMTGAGHQWIVNSAAPFTLANFLTYDAVFLAGTPVNTQVLIDYVNAGGNVYIAGGTGLINEPAVFNPFLNTFGLSYGPNYNGIGGEFSIGVPHPLFVGVQSMYHNNGNTVTDLVPGDSRQSIILTKNGAGLIGVYVSNSCVGDINTDGVVDDTDFTIFAAAYNILDCADPAMPSGCPADLNADGVVDDLDFVAFAAAYNDLVCP
ncbi:MAG: hypothetical protein K2Y21_01095 [Phycisphaerales bacterium]|nr:hypothetical protein [Phycisphaerales bacterium]